MMEKAKGKPDITVIVPIYNMASYIGDCLDALKSQTYKNFCVVIVDDGSTDDGKKVIDEYIACSTLDIHYVWQENAGVSAARNRGIDEVQTEYMCFADADDMLPSHALELYMRYSSQYDVVAGLASRNKECLDKKLRMEQLPVREGIEWLYRKFLFDNTLLQFCAFAYQTNRVKQYNIRFSTDLKYGEDEEFTWKYLCHCQSALFVDEALYYYRYNPTSASNHVSYKRTQVIDAMIRVTQYFKDYNNRFYAFFERLGIARAKLSILRQFAMLGQRDCFFRLVVDKSYDYKLSNLLLWPSLMIKIASLAYAISPSIFFYLFKLVKL